MTGAASETPASQLSGENKELVTSVADSLAALVAELPPTGGTASGHKAVSGSPISSAGTTTPAPSTTVTPGPLESVPLLAPGDKTALPMTNGLKLRIWPTEIKGLTHDVLNFTLRLVDPACDPDDGCQPAVPVVSNFL